MLASSTYKDNSHTGLKPTKTHYNLILLWLYNQSSSKKDFIFK
jgi:hypothetical protein